MSRDTTAAEATEVNLWELSSVRCEELMLKTLLTATVDRLLHHAHLYRASGDSIHLAQPLPERESLR